MPGLRSNSAGGESVDILHVPFSVAVGVYVDVLHQIDEIVRTVNEVIGRHLDVTISFLTHEEAAKVVDLSKLPENASEMLRIVRVGDYDACACAGAHVKNTSEVGRFEILSHDFDGTRWRVRWRVIDAG